MKGHSCDVHLNAGLVFVAFSLLLAACSSPVRMDAVPRDQQVKAEIPGFSGIRYWAERDPSDFMRDALDSSNREVAHLRASGQPGGLPTAIFLAISGGGENGAYGAGLLSGWTAAGTRPQFKGVTGISTGALIAPFAFLGSAYDGKLREAYTTISQKDVLEPRGYLAAIFDDAMADNSPLKKLVKRLATPDILEAIAVEHEKGRILLIGTTDLDARRPVIWNIGKLAISRHPKALDLFHDILVASAAIPGAFPPVMIDVEVDGKKFQEMHVDGGATAQVFIYPTSVNRREFERQAGARQRRLYLIRNARLDPDWAQVERSTLSIAGRAVSSLIQTQGVGDLYRIFLTTQRDSVDFNLAYIPPSFTAEMKEPFDREYMKALFMLGYELGAKGYQWAKVPPGYQAPEIEPPVESQPPARTGERRTSRRSAAAE
jgi:predicted acylesterase/phospholipase RssA